MYYERKLRDKRKTIWLLGLGLLFMMITLMHTDKIMAATSSGYAANGVQKNVTEYLPTGQNGENTTVGRYALIIQVTSMFILRHHRGMMM